MNNFLKLAYDAGAQQALIDAGLTKEASGLRTALLGRSGSVAAENITRGAIRGSRGAPVNVIEGTLDDAVAMSRAPGRPYKPMQGGETVPKPYGSAHENLLHLRREGPQIERMKGFFPDSGAVYNNPVSPIAETLESLLTRVR